MAEGKLDLPDDLILSKSSDQLKELVSDNSIPLSPQWLYTKTSESKMDVQSPTPVPSGNPTDQNLKDVWRLDGQGDKKDWRKTVIESEPSRKWREEERETGLLGSRRGDRRKTERRTDNVPNSRENGDSKNISSSERWHDVNSRAAVQEFRRDNKWSSRWGPEDKEKESHNEKKVYNDKDKEEPQSESQSVVSSIRATSEWDSDPRDKWRPRHRMESQSSGPTSYRAAPGFGLHRERIDGPSLGFNVGRGRAPAIGRVSLTSSIGACALFRNESIPGKQISSASMFLYPRGKLLDMYRKQKADPLFDRIPIGMDEVAPITQVALTEPLAFITPDPEEEASLNGIWKGRITSSEVYSSSGQDSLGDNSLVECCIPDSGEARGDGASLGVVNADNGAMHDSDSGLLGSHDGIPRGASTISRLNSVVSETYGPVGAGYQIYHGSSAADSSAFTRSSVLDGSETLVPSHEQDYTGKLLQQDIKVNYSERATPPEEFMFLYIDPHGVVQGPFVGSDIISWFEQGFFGMDLQVRLENAPEGTPFQDLGGILPYLKTSAHAHISDQTSGLDGDCLEANLETGISAAPVTEAEDSSSITGMPHSFSSYDNPSAQDNYQRKSELETYVKPSQAEDQSFLDFSAQDDEIRVPGRAGVSGYPSVKSSTSMHDALTDFIGQSTIPIESTEAAPRNQNENKLHPFGVLWSELEDSSRPVNRLPNGSRGAMEEPTDSINNWPIDSWKSRQSDPSMSLDPMVANSMLQFENVSNRFVDQLPSDQHYKQQFQNRNMLSHSYIDDPMIHLLGQDSVHRQHYLDHQAQDLEHLLTLQLQQQQKIQLQHQQKLQLQQEHQLHQKLLQEQQQSHARQLLFQQILQRQSPDSRFGQSHDFPRSNNFDQMLVGQQLLDELLQGSGHLSRNYPPYMEQFPAGNFGQLPDEGHQRDLLEQLLSMQMQCRYEKMQSQQGQMQSEHGQMHSEQIRALEFQLLQHEQLMQQEKLMQQEQLMQFSNGVTHKTRLEEQRHIDPLWPSDHSDHFLRSRSGTHRTHSTGLDFYQHQQRPPFEDQLGQLERNLLYQEKVRQRISEEGLPFEHSASLPRSASGLNLDGLNGLGLSQGLELRDPTGHMQSSGKLGKFTPGLQNQSLSLGELQLEPTGHWSGVDAQIAGDWSESQFRRSNNHAEHQIMRSEVRRQGEDSSNSWIVDGSTEDKSKRLFMELLHQKQGHHSSESPNMNRGEIYDRMAPSGLIWGSSSLTQTPGDVSDHDASLNASSTFGTQAFADERAHRLPGERKHMESLHRNNSFISGNIDGGLSSQNGTQAFSMFDTNQDSNDVKTWNNVPKNEGNGRMSFEAQDRMGKPAILDSFVQGELPAVTPGQQSSFNISGLSRHSPSADPYSDKRDLHNLIREDRRKDRVLVPSHGQDSVLLKRPPSSHSSSSHEGLLELMSDTANRTAISYSGIEGPRRETGATGTQNKVAATAAAAGGGRRWQGGDGETSEASFSEMLKKSSSMKNQTTESSDPFQASKGGKKKGKKGRQIDPALLGFKVASNRILMGEIQRLDDF